ncbi:hypothetical protein BC832DRAFT_565469 [Gaertneriomyces semiglobifer]|nr:hypothetical protein BC832DRAFT_565469 [Gaertneriomyces semiglobifer]
MLVENIAGVLTSTFAVAGISGFSDTSATLKSHLAANQEVDDAYCVNKARDIPMNMKNECQGATTEVQAAACMCPFISEFLALMAECKVLFQRDPDFPEAQYQAAIDYYNQIQAGCEKQDYQKVWEVMEEGPKNGAAASTVKWLLSGVAITGSLLAAL